MFKKFISFLSAVSLLAMLVPQVAFAVDNDTVVTGVTLTVALPATPATFDPNNSADPLVIDVELGTEFWDTELKTSKGHVKVLKGTTVIKTVTSWGVALPEAVPDLSSLEWDGKALDDTPEAKAICVDADTVCKSGTDYKIEVSVEFDKGGTTISDVDTADFNILPKVSVSNLAVSEPTFNPLTQTADISFKTSATGLISVEVLDGDTVKRTILDKKQLSAGTYTKTEEAGLAWDGKDGNGILLPSKPYTIRTTSSTLEGSDPDTDTVTVTVEIPQTVKIDAFSVTTTSGDSNFDPAKPASESLFISYTLSQAADSVSVDVKDANNVLIKSFSSSNATDTFSDWTGKFSNKFVLPGVYTVKISAAKSGETTVTDTKTFTVLYGAAEKGDILPALLTPIPSSFDPDVEDTVLDFTNTKDSDITVEIQNQSGDVLRTFDGYKDTNYNANDTHSIVWDGKNTSNSKLSVGTYKFVVVTRNDFGVVLKESDIILNNSGGSVSTSNSHISDISFKPSTKFEPAKDDEFRIQFDVLKELDTLKVFALRGSEKIELYDEESVDKESNVEIFWDGTDDDDEYVSKGTWKIQFESKLDSTSLIASKSINVDYEKPTIDELLLSKSKFDNDQGEFIYVLFKVEDASNVTLTVLEGNDEQEDIVEDMEVEKNIWYAVEWDGGSFDYDDDLDIKLTAANLVNEDVYDTEKISVDLAEDEVSSSKSNITGDYITPVITEGSEEMTIYYDLEDEADVEVTIHKGKTSSGSQVVQLLDITDQDSGGHSVSWDGKNSSGNKLSDGFYTYKIVSKKSSSETETGLFIVGDLGDIDGSGGSSSSSSGSSNKVSPGVIVDGVLIGGEPEPDPVVLPTDPVVPPSTPVPGLCAGFSDVSSSSKYCDAIDWVVEEGIFEGYPDGTFGENSPINRVELVKVLLEAFVSNLNTGLAVSGNLGFSDVQIGAWYMPYLNIAKALNVFHGDAGKSTARPSDTVNRAEALKLVFETLAITNQYNVAGCNSSYPDVVAAVWYSKYACESKKYNLFDPVNLLNLSPNSLGTRGEIAELLYRLHLADVI